MAINLGSKMGLFLKLSLLSSLTAFCPLLWASHSKPLPDAKCNSEGMSSPIKLSYSSREKSNQFLVGWSYLQSNPVLNSERPEVGSEFWLVRCLPPGRYETIGRGTVEKVNGNLVEAHLYAQQGHELVLGKQPSFGIESKNLIGRPMVGDEVIAIQKSISQLKVALSVYKIAWEDLFEKDEQGGFSFTLSEQGQELLRQKFLTLKDRRGRLMVQGFALIKGNRKDLRTETLMRAQSVTTFLIHEFQLNPDQVLSFGFGSDWLQAGMQPSQGSWPGQLDKGIVLKML